MEILNLLLPLSMLFVIAIGAILCWAIFAGQFEQLDAAAKSILEDDDSGVGD